MASEDLVKSEAPLAPAPARVLEKCFGIGVALRVLLFAATLVAVIVMATAKQSEFVTPPGIPFTVKVKAKFTYSPAFIYFTAALSVACLYSIITTLASLSVISKPASAKLFLLYFAFWDAVMLGIVASATGAAGGVGYIGLKGNSHSGWTKICNVYDKYCRHIGGATGVSLFAAVLLLLLTTLSSYSLYLRIRD